ncbi:MAG: alpha/beta hydrolase-fold protein [Anaerolineae bacterium]
MGLHIIHWRSNVIQKNTVMNVLVPEGEPPFPTIYLLHGLTGDSHVWTRFHNIERLMQDWPAVVVMPDADRSYCANDPRPGGLRYEDYISEEIRTYVERVLPVIPERGARAAVGLSMGGYGALLSGIRHPDLYCAAASISGSTYYGHDMTGRHEDDDVGALGRALPPETNDLFALTAGGALSERPVALRLSCGTEDHLHDTNVAFHEHLVSLGIAHEWVEHPGAHDHGTWDAQVPLALAWAMERMGAEQATG